MPFYSLTASSVGQKALRVPVASGENAEQDKEGLRLSMGGGLRRLPDPCGTGNVEFSELFGEYMLITEPILVFHVVTSSCEQNFGCNIVASQLNGQLQNPDGSPSYSAKYVHGSVSRCVHV